MRNELDQCLKKIAQEHYVLFPHRYTGNSYEGLKVTNWDIRSEYRYWKNPSQRLLVIQSNSNEDCQSSVEKV